VGRVLVGWDIGGANIKAARLEYAGDVPGTVAGVTRPFEMWRAPEALPDILRHVAGQLGPAEAAALTMTAELCDCFPTKRVGVERILTACADALPYPALWVLDVRGRWLAPTDAKRAPLRVASANWMATARLVASRHPDTILVDVGSTTTDIVPIEAGRVRAAGRTDPGRLARGELVYTGAVRTDVSAIVQMVPLRGRWCRTAAEHFAAAADVHLILGHLSEEQYTCLPPDGGDRTEAGARRRLARIVCADEEMLTAQEIETLARYVHHRQVMAITEGLLQVLSAMDDCPSMVTVTGVGKFLAVEAARRVGMAMADLDLELRLPAEAAASAVALAWLLGRDLSGQARAG
jgi:probable H4MPT-linked C1 transfer pathway protein